VSVAQTYVRPDEGALAELEEVLRHVGDELAAWRRRSLKAEAELAEARANGNVAASPELKAAAQRVAELEAENQALRQRIEAAKERLRVLATRLAFLEQQSGGTAA
jgi:chromosome segregation ATPase